MALTNLSNLDSKQREELLKLIQQPVYQNSQILDVLSKQQVRSDKFKMYFPLKIRMRRAFSQIWNRFLVQLRIREKQIETVQFSQITTTLKIKD